MAAKNPTGCPHCAGLAYAVRAAGVSISGQGGAEYHTAMMTARDWKRITDALPPVREPSANSGRTISIDHIIDAVGARDDPALSGTVMLVIDMARKGLEPRPEETDMRVTKTVSTNADGCRVLTYLVDGRHHARIIRRNGRRRYDVVFVDGRPAERGLRSRSAAEQALF